MALKRVRYETRKEVDMSRIELGVPTEHVQQTPSMAEPSVKDIILGERTMPFKNEYHADSCTRRTHCTCECDHINCPVFVG